MNDVVDAGGRRLAGQVLGAAARGDRKAVAQLLDALDAGQLRTLVTVLAAPAAQPPPDPDPGSEPPAVSPADVCEHAVSAAAVAFVTTPEAILGSGRHQTTSDARAVAMTVARQAGLSLTAIAEHFTKDHTSVIHAVRRTEDRPRLAFMAARIGDHLNARYQPVVRPVTPAFEPCGLVEHAVAAAAKVFETNPADVLGTDRTRAAADARAVAMTAARIRGQSLPAIARQFNKDHTTVLHATRRIEKSPPLRALAAQIAAGLPETGEPVARPGRRPTEDWDPTTTQAAASPGAGHERRVAPHQATPHLRAAR